jgi:stringent starvation protein B
MSGEMISNRPYFIRAMYEWIVDNDWTPHLQVDANYPGISVPFEYAEEGVIVLNVSPSAVVGLQMGNDWISFKARFSGVERDLGFPPEAVLAIFARENGQGMPFPPEPYPEAPAEKPSGLELAESSDDEEEGKPESKPKKDGKRPTLTVVK